MTIDYAARARALVGTRFRPQGRGPDGLDCVGVVICAFDLPPDDVRRDYQLHGEHDVEARSYLRTQFRRVSPRRCRPGDLLLMRVAADQFHFGVRTRAGFVHAHAGLRRVVEAPGEPDWPIIGIYRKRRR